MNHSCQFGFFNPRLWLAVVLCLVGALLGVASVAVPTPQSSTHSVRDVPAPPLVTITEFSGFSVSLLQASSKRR